jgi:hypothetical protein
MFTAEQPHSLSLIFSDDFGENPGITPGLVSNTLLYQLTATHHARTPYNSFPQLLIPTQSSGIYNNPTFPTFSAALSSFSVLYPAAYSM